MRFNFNLTSAFKANDQAIQILLTKFFIIGIFLPIKVSNVALLALLFFWIVTGRYRYAIKQLWAKKLMFLLVAFYLLHLIGLFYSDNLPVAYKELERKIPLLLLPIVISSFKNENFSGERRQLFDFYIRVTWIMCLFLVLYALYRYAMGGGSEVFYFKEFTQIIGVNPIYLAMYLLFAFGIYFYELNPRNRREDWVKKGLIYAGTLITLMCISSKTGLFVFVLLSLDIAFRQMKNLNPLIRAGIAVGVFWIVIQAVNYFPVTKERISDLISSDWTAVWQDDYTKDATTFTGFTLRISFWRVTLENLSEDNLLFQGVGTGDCLDYINKAYEKAGLIAAGYTDFNLHNAFMEVILEFGMAGLVFYLVIWGWIAIIAIRVKEKALMLLLVIFVFFSMTESILYVNKGLAFFSFWVSLLINFLYIDKKLSVPSLPNARNSQL